MKALRSATRPLRWLIERPSRVAVAYLVLIPAFAAVYMALGTGQFAQSSIDYEPGNYKQLRQEALNPVLTSLLKSLDDDWYQFSDRYTTTKKLSAFDPVFERGYLRFTLVGTVYDMSGPLDAPVKEYFLEGFQLGIDVDTDPWVSDELPLVFHQIRIDDPVTFAPEIQNPPEVRLAEKMKNYIVPDLDYELDGQELHAGAASPGTLLLHLPMRQDDETAFQNAIRSLTRGDPLAGGTWTEHVVRTLYLSAVTQTTLGFGDITPVSNSSRSLVALQAVFGVALAGAFFYSLSLANSEPRK